MVKMGQIIGIVAHAERIRDRILSLRQSS